MGFLSCLRRAFPAGQCSIPAGRRSSRAIAFDGVTMRQETSCTKLLARGDAEDAEVMTSGTKSLDDIAGQIVDAAFQLHEGPGLVLSEFVYETVLARDLERRGLQVERQKSLSFDYDGLHVSDLLRPDLIIEFAVIVEMKSVERLLPVHPKQVLTDLRLLNLPVGLLINFGAPTLKDGPQRVVNGLSPAASPRESAKIRHIDD